MADSKEPKPIKDMDDDELMAEVRKAVGIGDIAKVGKTSKAVKQALAKKTGKK